MRPFWTVVHRWLGLFVALFLIVSGLTGAVISWEHEIDGWLNHRLYDVASRGAYRSPFELAAAVEDSDPRVLATYLPLAFEEGHSAGFYVQPRIDPASGQPFALDYNEVFIDPVTARIVGRRNAGSAALSRENLMPFLRKLHESLHIPAMGGTDRWGYWFMGIVALVWLVDSFVGLYLTWPARPHSPRAAGRHARAGTAGRRGERGQWLRRWKPAWKVRTANGSWRLHFDLHRAGGLWTWGVILVLAFTSFSLNLNREVFYPLLSLVSKTTPGPYETLPAARPDEPIVPLLDAASAVRLARDEAARRGWTTPAGGSFYSTVYGFYNISFFRPGGQAEGEMALSNLYIDGRTGQLIGDNEPWHGTAADVFRQLQFPLHSGRILGLGGRILVSVMGLVVAMLSVTGIIIWARKRKARKQGHRQVRQLQARPSPPPQGAA